MQKEDKKELFEFVDESGRTVVADLASEVKGTHRFSWSVGLDDNATAFINGIDNLFSAMYLKCLNRELIRLKRDNEVKKGYEWFRLLSKERQKRFRLNVCRNTYVKKSFQLYLNRVNTFKGFIDGAFVFHRSKEGVEYWRKVREKYRDSL